MLPEWIDQELMGYFVIHAKTDRALFHVDHIRRMFALAGLDVTLNRGDFHAVHYGDFKDEIDRAYAKAFMKEGTPNVENSEA